MRVADTSFWLALFNEVDEFHVDAMARARAAETILVPLEVLVETLGTIQARHGRERAQTVLRHMQALPHVLLLHATDADANREVWFNARRNITWVDAAVVGFARSRKASVLTYDKGIMATLQEE